LIVTGLKSTIICGSKKKIKTLNLNQPSSLWV
jgi:hypothetical protein